MNKRILNIVTESIEESKSIPVFFFFIIPTKLIIFVLKKCNSTPGKLQ